MEAEELFELFLQEPQYAEKLKSILNHETETSETWKSEWDGWEWQDVSLEPGRIPSLLTRGLIEMVYKSRSTKNYRLRNAKAVREALEMWEKATSEVLEVEVHEIPDDAFDAIVGHDDAKFLLRKVLMSKEPTHAIMVGPPASAKSLFLLEIGRLPGATYVTGTGATGEGITERILLKHRPQVLLIDEMDKMGRHDMDALLSLCEYGIVQVTKMRQQAQIHLNTRVIGAANDISWMSDEFLSRFAKIRFREYRRDEFIKVAVGILILREGLDEDYAKALAKETWDTHIRKPDIRDAIRVARMADDMEDAKRILKLFREPLGP